jgi:hypothetical protein
MKEDNRIQSSRSKIITLSMLFVLSPLVLCTLLSGDTGHTYTLAQVRLVFKSGTERTGYMPLYSGWGFDTRDKLDEGKDVLDSIVAKGSRYFCLVDTFYTFRELRSMVATEDIEKIATDSVQQVLFLSWQGFSGAGDLDQLPLRLIQKLKSKPILNIQKVEGWDESVDYYCINQDSNISENEYILLFKYGPRYRRRDEFNRLLYLTTGGYYERSYGKKLPMGLLVDSLRDFVEYARQTIKNLSSPCNSPYIENLLLRVKTIYIGRLKFYEALISYLDADSTQALKGYIAEEISGDGDRDELVASIKKPSDEDWRSIVESVARLAAKTLAYGRNEDKLFDEIIEKHDIIVFAHSWD